MTRLPPETFDIPTTALRAGYLSAVYFNRAKAIARDHPQIDSGGVIMQVFQKNDAVLCGIDEALAVLKLGAGHWKNDSSANALFDAYLTVKQETRDPDRDIRRRRTELLWNLEDRLDDLWIPGWDMLEVTALKDGDTISPWESVMHIAGPYSAFAHLESVYLGVLARRTLIATNTRRVVEAANGKPVLFFADRFDHWATQGGDGYASHIGGSTGVASRAMGSYWGDPGLGTLPHALIAFFEKAGGDVASALFPGSPLHSGTNRAAFELHKKYPDVNLIPLVDFDNNCVHEAIHAVRTFGEDLFGVRLDTSENLVDQWFWSGEQRARSLALGPRMGDFRPTGVNPVLVEEVRRALDANDGKHVKIVASGGFNTEKIALFEAAGVPVDIYAVGSSLLRGQNDFTADIVNPHAKFGRWHRPNDRLEMVA